MTVQVVVPKWLNSRGKYAIGSFAEGLRTLGVDHEVVSLARARASGDPAVCWGIYKHKLRKKGRQEYGDFLDAQRKAGGDLVILERGWINREHYYGVGFGSINGRASYPHGFDAPRDRWDALGVPMRPWRVGGEDVVVIGQVPWDTSCQHVPQAAWVRETCRELRPRYESLTFRPHPLAPNAIPVGGLQVDRICSRSLDDALDRARLVVTFSSTVGVDALIRGVPVVACDRMSMVYDVCGNAPNDPVLRCDRTGWAHWIAYCQWNLKEMEQGLPWLHLYPGAA